MFLALLNLAGSGEKIMINSRWIGKCEKYVPRNKPNILDITKTDEWQVLTGNRVEYKPSNENIHQAKTTIYLTGEAVQELGVITLNVQESVEEIYAQIIKQQEIYAQVLQMQRELKLFSEGTEP